jgi:DNA-binding GntR family transcriptional regulator
MTDRPGRPQLEYRRIADALASRIESGEYAAGSRLPPEQALAEDFGVAYGTVRRAMDVLRERGLIMTIWGKGTFVREG